MRVTFLCIDPWKRLDGSIRPFNYSVRRVMAAVRADPGLAHVEMALVDTLSDEVEPLIEAVEASEPDVIAASVYVWSFPTIVEMARRLRARGRRTPIILGGPSARPDMFRLPPFADARPLFDALVLGEGEGTFPLLLSLPRINRDALRQIPGLALPTADDWEETPEAPLPPLADMPSPYQLGLVPDGVTGHLETFRGCPMSCTFCQWGDLSGTNRAFPVDYLVRELEAFRKISTRGVFIVDAALNLNAQAFRNLAAAEAQVGYLRTTSFHSEVYPSHMTEDHLRFLQNIQAESVGVGLQSYDHEVLQRLERPFNEVRFERVVHDLVSVVPSMVIEIIMGLPGDNPDSFRRTLERARKLGAGVRVYHCLVLPNALLSRAPPHFDMKFDPLTLKMESCWGWTRDEIEATGRELSDLVIRDRGEMGDGSGSWTFLAEKNRPQSAGDARRSASVDSQPSRSIPAAQQASFAVEVTQASQGSWSLREATIQGRRLQVRLGTPDGEVRLWVEPESDAGPSYRVQNGFAYSYGTRPGMQTNPSTFAILDSVITRLRPAEAFGRTALPVITH